MSRGGIFCWKLQKRRHQKLSRNFNTKATGTPTLPLQKKALNCTTSEKTVQDARKIVISGISGRYPGSESLEEFKTNLFNGTDMTTEQTRFKVGNKLPPRYGFMKNLDKFDAEFFGVSPKMAHAMDPAIRKLLQVAYEAIVDAGINPGSLKGSKTGVFVGTEGADPLSYWTLKHGTESFSGHHTFGALTLMQSNQVSHLLDLRGPSMSLNTACSSSLYALEAAVNSIQMGGCERAIVAATTLHLCSHHSYDLNTLHALSPTGQCRPFDKSANGFVRSEAVVALLIEKEDVALRNYAKILGVKTSADGMKKEGIFCPVSKTQEDLYRQVCADSGIDPGDVGYIETHGTGTLAGDPEELTGIWNVFCKGKNPSSQSLRIGSVKSNMGHGEAAAGLCGISKIILAAQEGSIPPNLNFCEPNEAIAHLFDGSVEVVTQSSPFTSKYVGVSAFGIGGTNGHALLEINSDFNATNPKNTETKNDAQLPVITLCSGPTKEDVNASLLNACSSAKDPNFTRLNHNVFKTRISGHKYKGYGIISSANHNAPLPELLKIERVKLSQPSLVPPVWFIFPGMGSQWVGMGKELRRVHVFEESVQKSESTLRNMGVDIERILSPSNDSIFSNIRDAFLSITVMQIALYDTLTSTGISPDGGIIGHSFGEILCAYADGCISREEALLIADARGRAMLDARVPGGENGKMASIGMSWSKITSNCPPGIFPACHNGPENVTVSGPEMEIHRFVRDLQGRNIFAKEINSCQMAAHSPLVYPAAELYLKYMVDDIFKGQSSEQKQRLRRSKKWLSTCIPEADIKPTLGQSASAEYFHHNFVNPVLFHDAVRRVPQDAVVIEIAPKGIFQGILKSTLQDTCTVLAPMQDVTKRNDRLHHFVACVGDLYNAGLDVDMSALYPPVLFPVRAETPSLGSLIKWNNQSWTVPIVENTEKYTDQVQTIDMNESAYKYLEGHKLDDRLVFPAAGYLLLAWKSYASSLGFDFTQLAVTLKNVTFDRAIFLNREKPTQLRCRVQQGCGQFEILESNMSVAQGQITILPGNIPEDSFESDAAHLRFNSENGAYLTSRDIYKELGLRGYAFKDSFKSIQKLDLAGKWAEVSWTGNWTTFLDSILQANIFNDNFHRLTCVPVRLQSLTIDPGELLKYVNTAGIGNADGYGSVPLLNLTHQKRTRAPGVELRDLTAHVVQRKANNDQLSINKYTFVPYNDHVKTDSDPDLDPEFQTDRDPETAKAQQESTLTSFAGIFLENCPKTELLVCNIASSSVQNLKSSEFVQSMFNSNPDKSIKLKSIATVGVAAEFDDFHRATQKKEKASFLQNFEIRSEIDQLIPELETTADLVLMDSVNVFKRIAPAMASNSWVMLHKWADTKLYLEKIIFPQDWQVVAKHSCHQNASVLLRKKAPAPLSPEPILGISLDGEDYDWLKTLQSVADKTSANSRIYLYSQNNPTSGIVGLVKCLRREPGGEKFRCIFDPEGNLKIINFQNSDVDLQEIVENNLVMNIYHNKRNGSYRHLPINTNVLHSASALVKHAHVNTLNVGDLSSLRWIESPNPKNSPTTAKTATTTTTAAASGRCYVNYAALNFRDIVLATGRLPMTSKEATSPENLPLGFEFSGRDEQGKRIMGMRWTKALATSVSIGPDEMVWDVPDFWTLEEAATVPGVYASVYYALCVRANLREGQSILIHSGTGGVGQAALNVALAKNCTVYTTVGSLEKKEEILNLFPAIHPSHVGSSKDSSFETQFLELTQGKGVDIVLNSLAEDKLEASLRCLGVGGTFLEIGKFDIYKNTFIGLGHLSENRNILSVDLVPVTKNQMPGRDAIQSLLALGIKSGVVKPLKRTVFPKDEVENAFRFMSTGTHVGKVLIQVKSEDSNETDPSVTETVKALPRHYCDPAKSYLIVGGLGGFGLELADWVVQRGGKHLVLVSRSGLQSTAGFGFGTGPNLGDGYKHLCLKKWRNAGVTVDTPAVDLSHFDTAQKFIQKYQDSSANRHIGGIFNSGLVLKDALMQNQTKEMLEAVAAPKIKITQNLDDLTRKDCSELECFVAFSSLSSGLGNGGQSNYGWANSAMENICNARAKAGHHALAIQWGVIGDVGYAAENMNGDEILSGLAPQSISSCLQVLDTFLEESKKGETTVFSSMVLAEKSKSKSDHTQGESCGKIKLTDVVKRLCSIPNPGGELDMAAAGRLGSRTLADLGLDSLSGTELQQILRNEYSLELNVNKIRALTWTELECIGEKKNFSNFQKKDSSFHEDGTTPRIKINPQICIYSPQPKPKPKPDPEIMVKLNKQKNLPNFLPKKLFIVHGSDGASSNFVPLAGKLNCDVYAFQTDTKKFGIDVEPPVLENLARDYMHEIKLLQPNGPYNIAGYSAGGFIALEIASQLETIGDDQVQNLILLDSYNVFKGSDDSKEFSLKHTNHILLKLLQKITNFTDAETSMYLKSLDLTNTEENRKRFLQILDTHFEQTISEDGFMAFKKNKCKTLVTLYSMVCNYRPNKTIRKIAGNVSLIKADVSSFSSMKNPDAHDCHFQQFCKNKIGVSIVPGDHQSFLKPENVHETALIINQILRQEPITLRQE